MYRVCIIRLRYDLHTCFLFFFSFFFIHYFRCNHVTGSRAHRVHSLASNHQRLARSCFFHSLRQSTIFYVACIIRFLILTRFVFLIGCARARVLLSQNGIHISVLSSSRSIDTFAQRANILSFRRPAIDGGENFLFCPIKSHRVTRPRATFIRITFRIKSNN